MQKMRPQELRPEHLAKALEMRAHELFELSENVQSLYKPTRMRRMKGGKLREIDVPLFLFKRQLRKLHRFLQQNFRFHPSVHGSVRGRSCFTAAEAHCGKDAVATRDISDCFPSISTERMRHRLLDLGFRSSVALLLSRFFTHLDRIPQGSPVSNDALNFYLQDLDENVTESCGVDVEYTRTADDHVLSGPRERVEQVADFLEREIVDHCLSVNSKKKQRNGLRVAPQQQLVHAIGVNNAGGTRISPEKDEEFEQLVARYDRAAKCVSAESLVGVAHLHRRVLGCINYCRQATFSNGKRLWRLFRFAEQKVQQRLRENGVTRSRKWWVLNRSVNRAEELAAIWRKKILSQKASQ